MARTQTLSAGDTSFIIGDDVTVEAIQDNDWRKLAEDEAFMNEEMEVVVHTSTDENAPSHVLIGVNGTNQLFIRGLITRCRRKYVEVLGRCWETKYSQPQRDMGNPESGNGVNGRSAHAYPFTVTKDVNPKGNFWLSKILAEQT